MDPLEESVQVLELGSEGYRQALTCTTGVVPSGVVEGFEIDVGQVFAE